MTIMNVHLERDRAIVVSNTEIHHADGATAYADKIFCLPQVNCVIAGRGEVNVLLNTYMHSYAMVLDFDGLAERWSSLMGFIVDGFYAKPKGDVKPHGAEIALVGWSKARQEMVCYHARIEEDGAMELVEAKGGVFTPWDESWGTAPEIPLDRASCLELARQQSQLGEQHFPSKCWRGDLTIVDMSIDSTTVSTVREFWKVPAHEPELATL